MIANRVSLQELLTRLERAWRSLADTGTQGTLAFDADGTLWSGDVGEDVFCAATARGALRPAALEPLRSVAQRFGVPLTDDASTQADALFDAYRRGALPEDTACEMMAWGFAGWDALQLSSWVADVLEQRQLSQRYFAPVRQVIEWARNNGLLTVVVSASPSFAVEVATASLGFSKNDIAGCQPKLSENGVYLPSLTAPLPYGQRKADALTRLAPKKRVLASFGDNVFDLAMLDAAEIPVAVRPKPALVERLEHHPRVVVLSD